MADRTFTYVAPDRGLHQPITAILADVEFTRDTGQEASILHATITDAKLADKIAKFPGVTETTVTKAKEPTEAEKKAAADKEAADKAAADAELLGKS